MTRLIFDLESNGLLDTMDVIHSLVIKDADTSQIWSCHNHASSLYSINYGIRLLSEADQIIGHNIIRFDIPAIQLIYPDFTIDEEKVFDTLVASRLIWPEIRDKDMQLWSRHKREHERKVAAWQRTRVDGDVLVETAEAEPAYVGFPGQLIGRHGLEAWGHRLGLHKGDYAKKRVEELKAKREAERVEASEEAFRLNRAYEAADDEDELASLFAALSAADRLVASLRDPTKEELDAYVWGEWNPEMQAYCELDVEVTEALWRKIQAKQYAETAFQLEHRFQWIIGRQEDFGFPFDKEAAAELERELMGRKVELEEQLREAFPPWVEETPFTPKRDNKTRGYKAGVTVMKRKEVVFNPGSRQHIAHVLKEKYGWKPTEWTKGGAREKPQPKVDETVLSKLDYPEAKLLVQYLTVTKRLGQLSEGAQAWLRNVREDDRIHGHVTTNGAVTGRCAHSHPNVAQTPSVRSSKEEGILYGEAGGWGYECRALFHAPQGFMLVGADASGLELRCLAHYMARWDGGAYGKILLEGDIHTANQEAAGLPTRANAKTFIYGFLYGAGDGKIGEIVAPTASEQEKRKRGAQLRAKFLSATPALKQLRAAVSHAAKERGWLKGLDGRQLHIRHEHAALNTLLQSAGALAVKQATVIFVRLMEEHGYAWGVDYALVAHIHDEMQIAAREEIAEHVAELAVQSFRDAGEHFGFRCPLDGEARIGQNWAETH